MGITTEIGNNYENVAAGFLKKLGFKILEKNYINTQEMVKMLS